MKLIPEEVKNKYYDCGIPITKDIKEGDYVLNLGSGSGQDCYITAKLVGPSDAVIGWQPKMDFRKGFIEDLKDISDNSIDVCISNYVICLSGDKPAVFKEVYRTLRQGGKFIFSDLYTYITISDQVKNHPAVVKERLGDVMIKSKKMNK